MKLKTLYQVIFVIMLGSPLACNQSGSVSKPKVTDVAHSAVKRQSIGNCWIYAGASWLESLYLSSHGKEINVSESYWTYWHLYHQIVNSHIESPNSGGSWDRFVYLVGKHGFVLEGEYLPMEAKLEMSLRQEKALEAIEFSLKDGQLKDPQDRTPEKVTQVLDQAFGPSMSDVVLNARQADEVFLKEPQEPTSEKTLAQLISKRSGWRVYNFPSLYGENRTPSARTLRARNRLYKRVLQALNDHLPVIMITMVDFNALDPKDGYFKQDRIERLGMSSDQGGHMLPLEDYVVATENGILGEGEMSESAKLDAAKGDLKYFVAKNSWGTNRPKRGLTDGYTRFDASYLESQQEYFLTDSKKATVWYTTLSGFVLPPGY